VIFLFFWKTPAGRIRPDQCFPAVGQVFVRRAANTPDGAGRQAGDQGCFPAGESWSAPWEEVDQAASATPRRLARLT